MNISAWFLLFSPGEVDETAKSLAALTGTDRTTWARARSEFFSTGVNKDSLDLLESALFHVSLNLYPSYITKWSVMQLSYQN